jgi:hypothetical protein
MKVEGIFEKLQDAVEKRLIGLNKLRNVPIVTYKQSDAMSIINTAVKTGIGVAILLLPPVPNGANKHTVGPVFSGVLVEVKLIEDPMTNRSGRTALSLAEAIMESLHGWHPGIGDESYQLTLDPGWNACRANRENDLNCITVKLLMPCHL